MALGNLRTARALLAFVVIGLLGAGCASGGGGGDGAAVVSPPPPPPPTSSTYLNPALVIPPAPAGINATEYAANYGVGATGSAAAWTRGYTGAGMRIGVIDDGMVDPSDPSYAELSGRIDTTNSIDIIPGRNQLSSTNSHGAELAAIMVGNPNGQQTVGVAYGATIVAVRADTGGGFSYAALADGLNYLTNLPPADRPSVVNFSLGGGGEPSNDFRQAVANATTAGIIIVVSAGNDGPTATDVNYPGRYASDPLVSNGLMIVAGGVNADGTFNDRSNYAGSSANYYMTAPGWEIVVPDFGPAGPVAGFQRCSGTLADSGPCASNMVVIQGTSYASPHITAAIALLRQAFPALTPQQIVQLALNSTDDQAAPGVDAVTGRGRFNLLKAFQPVGTVAAPIGGAQIKPGDLVGVSGSAFGDAFARANWNSVGFDSYDRTFAVNLAPSWRSAGAPPSWATSAPLLWRRDDGRGLSTSFALAETPAPAQVRVIGEPDQPKFRSERNIAGGRTIAFAHGASAAPEITPAAVDGHMAFAGYEQGGALSQRVGDSARLTIVSQAGDVSLGLGLGDSARRATALRLDLWRGPLTFGAGIGALREEGSVLGTAWGGRFGAPPEASTRFLAAAAGWTLARDWSLGVEGELGATRLSRSGWLSARDEIVTSAGAAALRWSVIPKALRAVAPEASGALSFSVSQPLRVEQGAFTVLMASANDWGRQSLSFASRVVEAAPSGREIDASVIYSLWNADNLAARFTATYRTEPGHRADAAPDKAVTVGLRYGF